jgi:hypothetical protein
VYYTTLRTLAPQPAKDANHRPKGIASTALHVPFQSDPDLFLINRPTETFFETGDFQPVIQYRGIFGGKGEATILVASEVVESVPESATVILFGLGLAGLGAVLWKHRGVGDLHPPTYRERAAETMPFEPRTCWGVHRVTWAVRF